MDGMRPIPWSAIDRYCDSHGIQDEQREDMHYFVRLLDGKSLNFKKKE